MVEPKCPRRANAKPSAWPNQFAQSLAKLQTRYGDEALCAGRHALHETGGLGLPQPGLDKFCATTVHGQKEGLNAPLRTLSGVHPIPGNLADFLLARVPAVPLVSSI
jgi:hypothetical protein